MQQQRDHVRKVLSITSCTATLLLAGSGALICTRLAQVASLEVPMAWTGAQAMEIAAYVAMLALLGAERSWAGYAVGAIALLAMRWAITFAGAGIQAAQGGDSIWQHAKTIQTLAMPRLAAIAFSVVAAYPLRDLLPGNPSDADGLAQTPKKGAEESEVMLLFGPQAGTELSPDEPAANADGGRQVSLPPAPVEGSIFLPLAVVMKNVPAFSAHDSSAGAEVEVPLALIVPHLKAGKIVIAARELAPHLPAGVIVEQEAVELPLREVVLSLPPETLQLPPANSPAWARVEGLEEEILFAAV